MDSNTNSYFVAYEDLMVQKLMLTDTSRVEAYKNAIFENKNLFLNKAVLDVGAGTGILSVFCAQAGARRVYAVEAAPKLISVLEGTVADNNLQDKIKIINSKIEDVNATCNGTCMSEEMPELVDIIISEWMGFFLVHEGMINSVIKARERFLKPDGIMFPAECTLYAALCELPEHHDAYEDFYGISMKSFGQHYRRSLQSEPQIYSVKKEWLLSKPAEVKSFKICDVLEEELKSFSIECVLPALRKGTYQGLCLYFSVSFPTPSGSIILSTAPSAPETHWKQTIIVFMEGTPIDEKEAVAFHLLFQQKEERKYEITFSHSDPDDMDHSTPCECSSMKCRVIKAFLDSTEGQQ